MGTVPGYALTTGTWHLPGFVEAMALGDIEVWRMTHPRFALRDSQDKREKKFSQHPSEGLRTQLCFLQIPQIVLKVSVAYLALSWQFRHKWKIIFYLVSSCWNWCSVKPSTCLEKETTAVIRFSKEAKPIPVTLLTCEKRWCPWLTSQRVVKTWYFQGGDTQSLVRERLWNFAQKRSNINQNYIFERQLLNWARHNGFFSV